MLWLLANVLSLWSPSEGAEQQQQSTYTDSAAVSTRPATGWPDEPDMLGQALPLYSMMRQVGTAMLRHKASCHEDAMQMVELLSSASQSGHWWVNMTTLTAAACAV